MSRTISSALLRDTSAILHGEAFAFRLFPESPMPDAAEQNPVWVEQAFRPALMPPRKAAALAAEVPVLKSPDHPITKPPDRLSVVGFN
jgi:hypothetical protein